MREERLQKSWVFGGIAELEIERSLEEQNRGGERFFFPGRDLRSRRGRLWTWRGGDYSEQRKKKGNSGGRRLQTKWGRDLKGKKKRVFTEFLFIWLERTTLRYAFLLFFYSFLGDFWGLLVSMFIYMFFLFFVVLAEDQFGPCFIFLIDISVLMLWFLLNAHLSSLTIIWAHYFKHEMWLRWVHFIHSHCVLFFAVFPCS